MNLLRHKILVISHLAMNKTNNVGKTLAMMFQCFDPLDLAQLYFNDADPDEAYCSTWFRITDTEMMKSIFGKKAGNQRVATNGDEVETHYSSIHKKSVGRSTQRLLARDIVWKLGRINRKKLFDWIESFSPTVIFLAPGYNVFSYDIAKMISEKENIPIITYLMDEYFFEIKQRYSILEFLRTKWLRHAIKRTINNSRVVYAVSQEMAQDYYKIFHKKIDVLYTPYEERQECIKKKHDHNGPITFFYAGSVGVGRWEVLQQLGKALEQVDNCILNIYASRREQSLINMLDGMEKIRYCGFVSGEELKEKMLLSDIVVHVESFDKKELAKTKYSISTKIPECLACQKPFLAIGPIEQSSISYLKSNNLAIVCENYDEMNAKVAEALKCLKTGYPYAINALKVLQEHHNPQSIYKQLINDIQLIK